MKNSFLPLAAGLACLGSLTLPTVQAAVIAYDGFDGSPTGFSSNFAASNSGGLTYSSGGNVLTTGGGARTGTTDTTAILTSGISTGTVWMSFLVQYTTTPLVEFARLQLQNGSTEMFQLAADRDATNAFYMSRRGGAGGNLNTSTGVGIVEDQTFLIVGQLNLTGQTANFWVNPTLSLSEPTSPQASFTTTGFQFDRLQLVFNSTSNVIFDEVRIGDSFTDVTPFTAVPEPATSALLLGSIGTFRLLRRRR